MTVATKPAAKTAKILGAPSVGSMIDALFANREERRALEAQIKTLNEAAEKLEEELLARLDKEGLDKATGRSASASVSSSVAANVEDWDSLFAYIKKTGYFHLVQRRVSDPAYRELLEAGKKVPGVQPFTKKRLNLRVLSS